MARLIDADAIYNAVERRYQVSSGIEHRCERDLLDLICSADTVDAVPVVHGRWSIKDVISKKAGYGVRYYYHAECEVAPCRLVECADGYCPNCGAVMDLEVKDA